MKELPGPLVPTARHGAMTEPTASPNATQSEIGRRLHSLPHYNLKFARVSNVFDPLDWEYQQALLQYAWPFAAVAVVTLLAVCIKWCCCKRKQPSGQKSTACLRTSSVVFCLASV